MRKAEKKKGKPKLLQKGGRGKATQNIRQPILPIHETGRMNHGQVLAISGEGIWAYDRLKI